MKPPVTTIEAVREAVTEARKQGRSIGLVPTMGALHAGHASLIRAARAETGFVVVSLFVNPTQFGPNEDYARYPRSLPHDLKLCTREGVGLVFAPDAATMYPPDFRTYVEVHGMQHVLCGASRPIHFRGVATVVLKLFHIVQPDLAYFGQKDAQQARLLQQMVRDLNVPVQVRVCPIVREPDGLALSSRNQYLDPDQRRQAVVLYQALEEARGLVENGERNPAVLIRRMMSRFQTTPGAVVDYVAVVDAETLQPVERLSGTVLVAVAVKFGTTRLIDNTLLQIANGSLQN
jgi:pantoate--beta-alanine ligase